MYRFDPTTLSSFFEQDCPLDQQISLPLDCTTSLPSTLFTMTFAEKDTAEEGQIYEIEEIIESASAFVCIAHRPENREQRLVFKILREFKDDRYHYGSQEDRFACQKEALRKNLTITPNIYLGLARIVQLTLQEIEEMKHTGKLHSIKIGTIVPESDRIERRVGQNCEFALVMFYLPNQQRLDRLLREEDLEQQKKLLHLLATRIEQIHRSFLPPDTVVDEDGDIWGSYEQLFKKLMHNLAHFDLIEQREPLLYKQYHKLKAYLRYFIEQQWLQDAFKQRLRSSVKQCHGDLKAKNTWIKAIKPGETPLQSVHILDAIDFNESYRNIDVLADLAMMVVDVEAIAGEEPGAFLKKEYLALSGQTEESAKLVLEYYLLEKAVVSAIMCLVYDHHERHMGQPYLAIASRHANKLHEMNHAID